MQTMIPALLTGVAALLVFSPAKAAPADEYRGEIRPILEKHCYECHGPEKQKAKLDLSSFSEFDKVIEAKEIWQVVLERIQAYEMPPEGKPELGFSKQQKLMRWLRALPKPDKPDCDQIASDRNANFYKGYVMSRRLNRAEYSNTVRDLLGIDLHLEAIRQSATLRYRGTPSAGAHERLRPALADLHLFQRVEIRVLARLGQGGQSGIPVRSG